MNIITIKKIKMIFLVSIVLLGCKEIKEAQTKVEKNTYENFLEPTFQSDTHPIYYSIEDRLKYYNIAGASIAIVTNGEISHQKKYGYAKIDNDSTLINSQTLFQAGSISKSITAIAIMKLAENNVIDLDTDINTYLKTWKLKKPSFLNNSPITIRQLLSHTSGMINNNYRGFQQDKPLPSLEEMLDGKPPYRGTIIDTIPETIHRYSNTGYGVLEKLIEDVSNKSFENAMNELVLKPFSMHNSTFETLTNKANQNISYAFDSNGKVHEGQWYNPAVKGGGGLWSTASDLARFCIKVQQIAQGNDNFISSTTMLKMLQPVLSNYGLGFYLKEEGDNLIFFHSGKMKGFTNLMMSYVHKKSAIIVLTNSDQGGYFFSEVIRGISKQNNWSFMKPKDIETVELSDELQLAYQGSYSGTYEDETYKIEIKKSGKHLILIDKDKNDKIYNLRALSDTLLLDVNDGEKLTFKKHNDSDYEILWNNLITFKKVN